MNIHLIGRLVIEGEFFFIKPNEGLDKINYRYCQLPIDDNCYIYLECNDKFYHIDKIENLRILKESKYISILDYVAEENLV